MLRNADTYMPPRNNSTQQKGRMNFQGTNTSFVFATSTVSINPVFLTLNTFAPTPGKHPKIPCSYYTQLKSRSPIAALPSPLGHGGFSWSRDDLSGLSTHSIVMSREKIYNQISHLEKGRMASLVNSHGTTLQVGIVRSLPWSGDFLDFPTVFNLGLMISPLCWKGEAEGDSGFFAVLSSVVCLFFGVLGFFFGTRSSGKWCSFHTRYPVNASFKTQGLL